MLTKICARVDQQTRSSIFASLFGPDPGRGVLAGPGAATDYLQIQPRRSGRHGRRRARDLLIELFDIASASCPDADRPDRSHGAGPSCLRPGRPGAAAGLIGRGIFDAEAPDLGLTPTTPAPRDPNDPAFRNDLGQFDRGCVSSRSSAINGLSEGSSSPSCAAPRADFSCSRSVTAGHRAGSVDGRSASSPIDGERRVAETFLVPIDESAAVARRSETDLQAYLRRAQPTASRRRNTRAITYHRRSRRTASRPTIDVAEDRCAPSTRTVDRIQHRPSGANVVQILVDDEATAPGGAVERHRTARISPRSAREVSGEDGRRSIWAWSPSSDPGPGAGRCRLRPGLPTRSARRWRACSAGTWCGDRHRTRQHPGRSRRCAIRSATTWRAKWPSTGSTSWPATHDRGHRLVGRRQPGAGRIPAWACRPSRSPRWAQRTGRGRRAGSPTCRPGRFLEVAFEQVEGEDDGS